MISRDRSRSLAVAQTASAYSVVAESYDRLVVSTDVEDPLDLAMITHFLTRVGKGRGAELLDAGCGAGRMLTHLERLDRSLQLTGVDLAPGMVALARAHHPTREIDVAELAALPFDDDHFDGVLCWYSIIHTRADDVPPVIAELRRVLGPGGSLLLGFHVGRGEWVAHRAYGHDVDLVVQRHAVAGIVDQLTGGGFEVIAQLDRAARRHEKDAQGFVLAVRT